MEHTNHGVLVQERKPTDYILGSVTGISTIRIVKDWSIYLPAFESQRNSVVDFLDCVSMAGPDHSIAMQLNYLLFTNQLSDEALNFFHNGGYIVDGIFSLSARFNAKMNGTDTLKGQYLTAAAEDVRKNGFLPERDLPTTDSMSWNEFYKDIPQSLKDKAKKALWYVSIQYQFIPADEIANALKAAPVQIATAVCPGWDQGTLVPKCTGRQIQHSTVLYGQDTSGNWLNLDQYPPYTQKLAHDYELPHNLQYIVSMKPMALRKGMQGVNVLALQENLNKLGFKLETDSFFGPITEKAVISIQNKMGLVADGIYGTKTNEKLLKLIGNPKTILEAIIEVESGGNDNAHGDTHLKDNAYGCLQIRQGVCDDVNRKFGTKFKSQDCLGNRSVSLDIWDKYWKVYPLITTNEDRSRTWNGGPGWKKIYFKANKNPDEIKYCSNIDMYWEKVKKLL